MSVTVRDENDIVAVLNQCLNDAGSTDTIELPEEVKDKLNSIFDSIDVATTGFLNLLTCLVCSAVNDSIDPRYHRQPGRGMPKPEIEGGWFSGRTISEKIIYPWMESKGFRTAKSGWQTRTFERPNPYTLDYPENIAHIREPFLYLLDYASKNRDKSKLQVSYLLRKEIDYQNNRSTLLNEMAKNRIGNEVLIVDIIASLEQHFSLNNSAHLPVLAIYSIYELLINEVGNYHQLGLKELERHQASDLRTGAVGDIELVDSEGDVIEAIEVKHRLEIGLPILLSAKEKILRSRLKRYYILTTHRNCTIQDTAVEQIVRQVYSTHGCQIIVNGVIPTIKYYLRMCVNPSVFLEKYSRNLSSKGQVTVEQLEKWQDLISDLGSYVPPMP